MNRDEKLDLFFRPRGIAVVGASKRPRSVSARWLQGLRRHGYEGAVYAVNPNYDEVEGFPCVPTLADIPEQIDAAVLTVPGAQVADMLVQCGAKGISGAVVFAAGFGEKGADGRSAEEELARIADENGVVMLGPNGPGFVNFHDRCCAIGTAFSYREDQIIGNIGAVVQSGGVAGVFGERAQDRGIGLSFLICSGNQADFTSNEAIEFLVRDPNTKVIVAFYEGVVKGPQLERAFQKAQAAGKPIVFLKAGRSELGGIAASLHTGSLIGSDETFSGLCRQYGVERVDDIDELWDVAAGLALLDTPAERVGVLTTSGGVGVLAVDEIGKQGLEMPQLEESTQDRLRELLPGFAAFRNPADMTAHFVEVPEVFTKTIEIFCTAEELDTVVLVLTVQKPDFAMELVELSCGVPESEGRLLVIWYSGEMADEARAEMRRRGFALVEHPGAAARALRARNRLVRLKERPAVDRSQPDPVGDGKTLADLGDLLEHLRAAGVAMPAFAISDDAEQSARAVDTIPGPWAVKTAALEVTHKSDSGALRLGIDDVAELRVAHDEVVAAAQTAGGNGRVVVQSMTDVALELLVAAREDPMFGWTVAIGLGGTLTELIDKAAVRRPPLTAWDVEDMLDEIGATQLLTGFRWAPPLNPQDVADIGNKLAAASASLGSVEAVELNPVILSPSGELLAIDAAPAIREPRS
ncbi:Trans-feruloyl-CoA synthase FCS1 [Baekduia alba]|uniref:acetate--CoA ligase family protein n=1 Tax=Baekduia alba TaxID=2997333 RepID=UPI0023415E87|nr:acetate--CoA ligase family protein [Baekduia alba]WCB91805.1 Trans-feruloyl-CoA synthase FCS1 [Baekduia alba]